MIHFYLRLFTAVAVIFLIQPMPTAHAEQFFGPAGAPGGFGAQRPVWNGHGQPGFGPPQQGFGGPQGLQPQAVIVGRRGPTWLYLQAQSTGLMFKVNALWAQVELIRSKFRIDENFCRAHQSVCDDINNAQKVSIAIDIYQSKAVGLFQFAHGRPGDLSAYIHDISELLPQTSMATASLIRRILQNANFWQAVNPVAYDNVRRMLDRMTITLSEVERMVRTIRMPVGGIGTFDGPRASYYQDTFDFNYLDVDRYTKISDIGNRQVVEHYFLNANALWMRAQVMVALMGPQFYGMPIPHGYHVPSQFPVDLSEGMGIALLAETQKLAQSSAQLLQLWSSRDYRGEDIDPRTGRTRADTIFFDAQQLHFNTMFVADLVSGYVRNTFLQNPAIIESLEQSENLTINCIELSNMIRTQNILGIQGVGVVFPQLNYGPQEFGYGRLPYQVQVGGELTPLQGVPSALPQGTPAPIAQRPQVDTYPEMQYDGKMMGQISPEGLGGISGQDQPLYDQGQFQQGQFQQGQFQQGQVGGQTQNIPTELPGLNSQTNRFDPRYQGSSQNQPNASYQSQSNQYGDLYQQQGVVPNASYQTQPGDYGNIFRQQGNLPNASYQPQTGSYGNQGSYPAGVGQVGGYPNSTPNAFPGYYPRQGNWNGFGNVNPYSMQQGQNRPFGPRPFGR